MSKGSVDNTALVHSTVDAFNRRDLTAFLALIGTDVEFIPLQAEMEGGDSLRGHDGVRYWWDNLFSVFPDFSAEAVGITDLGRVTVTQLRLRGEGRGSNARMEQTDWQATEWRSGKAVWWRTFRNEPEALEAAGLRG